MASNPESGLTLPDVAKVAEAFGVKSMTIRNNEELDEKVREALEYPGPLIIKVITPLELTASPKQVSYMRKDGQMESLPLEFMNPPLSEAELEENMLIPMYELQ